MNRNVFLVFALFLLFSCVPEKPSEKVENKTADSDSLRIALEKAREKSRQESDSILKDLKGQTFKLGFAEVSTENKWEYIKKLDSLEKNKIVTEDSIKRFRQAVTILDLSGCDAVYIGTQIFVTTKKSGSTELNGAYSFEGKEIFKPIYENIEPNFFEPLILCGNEDPLFINLKGKIVLSGYQPSFPPDDKYYIIVSDKNNKYGAYNVKTEQMLIAPTFDSLGLFENEKALAVKHGERFYIDRKGNKTSPPNF